LPTTFFLAATAPRPRPFRVRALVCVRWPRTGRFRRCGSAIRLNFNQPADIHLDLLAEIAFHAAFLFDGLAKMIDFIFGQSRIFFV